MYEVFYSAGQEKQQQLFIGTFVLKALNISMFIIRPAMVFYLCNV